MPTPTTLRFPCSILVLAALAVVVSPALCRSAWAEAARPPSAAGAGDEEITELMVELDSADAGERLEAVRRLGASGAPAAPSRLAERLRRDEAEEVRLEAATVLGDLGGEDEVAPLHESATSDESEGVRWAAWVALLHVGSRVGSAVVLPMIVDTLQHHPRSATRIEAARALAGLGDEAALGPLAAAAATDPVQTVQVAARAAHDELRRALDLSVEEPVAVGHAGPELDEERPPARQEAPRGRRPGTTLLISGGVLAGVGLAATITGFALLPGADSVMFSIALGLGIPGVLVAIAGVSLLVVGLLRWFGPAERQPRPGSALAASLALGPPSPRGLSYAGLW